MMKTIIFAALAAGSSWFAFDKADQDIAANKVPAEVKASLSEAFPNAADLEWEKNAADFEADFDVDTVEYSALLNASGKMLMHKHDIAATELPAEVKAAITQKYAGYQMDDAEVIDKAGTRYYQIELEKENAEKNVVLATDGQEQTQVPYWD